MRAYELGSLSAQGSASTQLSVGISDGPYRLRTATDLTWHSQGYGQQASFGRKVADAVRAVLRMVLPVLALFAALSALYLYMDTPLAYFTDATGKWLTAGHVLLPVAFLMIHLTNRRYGPNYAFAQVAVTLALLVALIVFGGTTVRLVLPPTILPSVREVTSFGGAFFVAALVSIIAFDGARGPRWWMAPLVGSLAASVIYVLLFYPAAYLGSTLPWPMHMTIHGGVLLGGAVLSLVPYWFLRGLVQPLPGFGGY